jgi:hypothetical protein
MKFSQATIIAFLAATAVAKPILARGDESKSMDEYNKCCESQKHDTSLVCVPPSESTLPGRCALSARMDS